MAKNSKTSIRKRLDRGFKKAFPGMRVFVKRSPFPYAEWIIYIWEHGRARNATAHVLESFSKTGHRILEDAIEWVKIQK